MGNNRFMSLLWLRWQFIWSNKLFLLSIISPVIYMGIFAAFGNSEINKFLVGMGLNLVYSFTAGSFVSTMISEEKEKKNLKSLILSGVKQGEYITTVIIFPFIFSLVASILIPIMMQIEDMEWGKFLVVVSLTSLVFILLNLLFAFLAKNQTQTTVCSLTLVLVASILPVSSEFVKSANTVMEYSFIGANAKYFKELSDYQLTDKTIFVLLSWIIVTSIALYFAYKKNRKID
ncbi:ABC transporter permease [Streptococcus equinus]|uniref:ABC transporter permease n=1 Tax=Streptococcus equinus TaxID=1335 RepID=UPI0037D7B28F